MSVIGKLALICHAFRVKHPRNFDKTMAAVVARIPRKFEPAMILITNSGGFWFVAIALVALSAGTIISTEHQLLASLAVIAALAPLAELAKLVTRRKRPETLYAQQMRFKTYSFPSGHSYVSALMAGYLSSLAFIYISSPLSWICAVVLLGFAILVGISRVYLGAHFPSDVLGGWLLAFLMLYLTAPLRAMLP